MKEFDENDAVKFMRDAVGAEISAKYPSDDELLNLIDMVFDYYEANGLLDLDLDDDDTDDEVDFDDLMDYVVRMLKKDKAATLSAEDARALVEAYFDYEESCLE